MALNLADACASCVLHAPQKCGNVETLTAREISREMVDSAMTQRFVRYDNRGEEHYNIASALQKSIVGRVARFLIREAATCRRRSIGWRG